MKLYLFAFLVTAAIFATSCGGGGSDKTTQQQSGSINIDGSSTVYPITEAVAEEYRAFQPKVKVTVGISGTGGGFKKFGRGEIDIVDASRPIKKSEIELCNENNVKYVGMSVAYDGLAVLINPENDWVDYFTVEELNKLWTPDAQGKITHWNQIRAEWPNEEIHLYGPGIASGTYDYFTEAITGEAGHSRGDYTASEDDNILVQGIASDKYSLGFFGLAYFEENKDKLKLIAVDGGNGPIYPSLETVSNGTYSPLSRPLFIYVNSNAKNEHVADFVRFYLNEAPDLCDEVGYVPMPAEEYKKQLAKFNEFVESL
jgi:phosphate transport system substrate-binding protein